MFLFMLSSGLTLIFGMMGVLNFAHASFFMLGAYIAYQINLVTNFWIALLLAPIVVALIGGLTEKFALRKIHKFGHLHLEDIIERRSRFKNKLIIAAHFSTRYHKNTIRNLVEKKLPDMLDGRLHLWI